MIFYVNRLIYSPFTQLVKTTSDGMKVCTVANRRALKREISLFIQTRGAKHKNNNNDQNKIRNGDLLPICNVYNSFLILQQITTKSVMSLFNSKHDY